MTTTQFQTLGVAKAVESLLDEVSRKVFRDALKESGKLLEHAYREQLLSQKTKPGNTGISGSDPGAIVSKVGYFKDEHGAWLVVGAALVGGRPLAPSLRFGELGTVERWTKRRQYRGRMPAQYWARQAVAVAMNQVKVTIKARIAYLVARG